MKNIFYIIPFLFIISCNNNPKSINYGLDKCDLCGMHILDHKHATLLTTDTHDYLKFDSAECLMNYQKTKNESNVAELLTNTIDNPNHLINATSVTYLISKNLPSPMGYNLNAYTTRDLAEIAQKKHGGKIYTYSELKEYFNKSSNLKLHE